MTTRRGFIKQAAAAIATCVVPLPKGPPTYYTFKGIDLASSSDLTVIVERWVPVYGSGGRVSMFEQYPNAVLYVVGQGGQSWHRGGDMSRSALDNADSP